MKPTSPSYLGYWGKTAESSPGVVEWHPVAYHGLDVAACGRVLLEGDALLRRRLATLAALDEEQLVCWICFLLALHDLGKLADTFQGLVPELFAGQGRPVSRLPYVERHDVLGYRLWQEALLRRLLGADSVFPQGQSEDWEDWRDLLVPWIQPAAGHHGVPPRKAQHCKPIDELFPAVVVDDAVGFALDAARLLLPPGVPFDLDPLEDQTQRFKLASWPFAGLAVEADWLGSDVRRFPLATTTLRPEDFIPLEEYWQAYALPRAREAVGKSGLARPAVSLDGGIQRLFGFADPTDLQQQVETLPLAAGPQLITIEELTGGGKTEAAVVLAHRLMAADLATGLYFALPTMATANAMYRRVESIFERLFVNTEEPSLVLAHAKRHLFLGLEATAREVPGQHGYGGDEPTGSQTCSAWLGDSRKKALLAAVGVGTIDQALLAVLPARHQSLRLVGLVGKVLLVDEVHACDAYVSALLERLLEFHAALGGSAILLSATLPRSLRRKLRRAFAKGLRLGGFGEATQEPAGEKYPLLTLTAVGKGTRRKLRARKEVCRRVHVQPLRNVAQVEAFLDETLEAGGCACWIRNTVADAQEAYARARLRYGSRRVTLFHARFAVGDRADLEARILETFGPASGPDERRGQLLIATQVAEQSLDLDFDRMAADLCPIDLVLQRAGRLLRHRRDLAGRRLEEPAVSDGRGEPVLGLFGPAPQAEPEADWYSAVFEKGAFVYPDHGRLWLTARWLEERRGFRVPEQSRELIENVYGEDSEGSIPQALLDLHDKATGRDQADHYLGAQNALDLAMGYSTTGNQWPEDLYAPTRLGEPTVTLRLVRREGESFLPWYESPLAPRYSWELSEVSCRETLVSEEDFEENDPVARGLRAEMEDQGRYCKLVVLEPSDRGEAERLWAGTARDRRGRRVRVVYSRLLGLEVEKA